MLYVSSLGATKKVIRLCFETVRNIANYSPSGYSFYNIPYIPQVLELLSKHKLVEQIEGAREIFFEVHQIPLTMVKIDWLQLFLNRFRSHWLVTE